MIILASQSPRRKELLSLITDDFIICPADVDETVPDNIHVEKVAEYLSKIKALALKSTARNGDIIIGADTIVVYNNEIFGKPKDETDAFNMLKTLSGNTHQVITGVTLIKNQNVKSFSVITEVKFNILTDDEINKYIATKEPIDKAGAYGIQGKASLFIEKINGDYFNVVGLPVSKLYEEIKKMGY